MTAFSRALVLAGLIAVTGVSGALADPRDNDEAQAFVYGAQEQNAPVLQEGRSSVAVEAPARHEQNEQSWLTDRRSSDWN